MQAIIILYKYYNKLYMAMVVHVTTMCLLIGFIPISRNTTSLLQIHAFMN